MGTHITENDSIHDINTHGISTSNWQGTLNISVYALADYGGASFICHVTDGTNKERIIVELGDDGTDTGYDETRILVAGEYMDLTFSTSINSGDLILSITNGDGVASNTIKYYAIPSAL